MLDFFSWTVEYQGFGYNVATFSSVAVAVLTFVELYALFVQGRSVWRQNSGQSLNVLLIAYATFISFATGIYGLEIKSVTLIWNGGGAGFLGAWVLVGLYKFKEFSRWERFLVPLVTFMPIAMFLPQRQFLYAILPLGLAFSTGAQLKELYTTENRGVVEPQFLIAYAILSGSWIAFGIAIKDWAVWAPQVLICTLFLATIIVWRRASPLNCACLDKNGGIN